MKILRRILRNELFVNVVARLFFYLMRFLYATTKWRFVNYNIPEDYIKSGRSLLVALWHDRLMTAPCAWSFSSPLNVLASAHRDGRLIAQVVKNCGMNPIYGSTGKLPLNSGKALIELCKKKACVAIIPDGPRGPRHEVAPGVISVAKATATDILVFSSCVKRFKKCRSWDQFIIPYPFNKGVIVLDILAYDEIKELSTEECCKLLKAKLNSASSKAKDLLEQM